MLHNLGESQVEHFHLLTHVAISVVHDFSIEYYAFALHEVWYGQIQGQVGERRLEAHAGGYVHVEKELLQSLLYVPLA